MTCIAKQLVGKTGSANECLLRQASIDAYIAPSKLGPEFRVVGTKGNREGQRGTSTWDNVRSSSLLSFTVHLLGILQYCITDCTMCIPSDLNFCHRGGKMHFSTQRLYDSRYLYSTSKWYLLWLLIMPTIIPVHRNIERIAALVHSFCSVD